MFPHDNTKRIEAGIANLTQMIWLFRHPDREVISILKGQKGESGYGWAWVDGLPLPMSLSVCVLFCFCAANFRPLQTVSSSIATVWRSLRGERHANRHPSRGNCQSVYVFILASSKQLLLKLAGVSRWWTDAPRLKSTQRDAVGCAPAVCMLGVLGIAEATPSRPQPRERGKQRNFLTAQLRSWVGYHSWVPTCAGINVTETTNGFDWCWLAQWDGRMGEA